MGLFGNSKKKKLKKNYEKLLKEAMLAQRSGNIQKAAELHESATRLSEEMNRQG